MSQDSSAPSPTVALTDVHKTYGAGANAVEALRGVTLAFLPRTFHAILGPSGSGKSTLLHLASGLDVPTRGSVRLLDSETAQLDETSLARLRRRRVGFVFQFFNLVPSLSVEENALLPILLDRDVTPTDRSRLDALLDGLGIAHRRTRLPEELSGGERQRAAIVRAMLPAPPVIFADEPTGSLDSVTGNQITHALREQVDAHGVTLVVVTHDRRVADAADVVIELRDGQVLTQTATRAGRT